MVCFVGGGGVSLCSTCGPFDYLPLCYGLVKSCYIILFTLNCRHFTSTVIVHLSIITYRRCRGKVAYVHFFFNEKS